MKRIVGVGLLAISTLPWAGCSIAGALIQASAPKEAAPVASDVVVRVLSEPAGARIEVNNNYVGDAPLDIRMRSIDGRVAEKYVVRALPIHDGHFSQTKLFNRYEKSSSDRVPDRIFFDMRLKPRADVDVDVNVK